MTLATIIDLILTPIAAGVGAGFIYLTQLQRLSEAENGLNSPKWFALGIGAAVAACVLGFKLFF